VAVVDTMIDLVRDTLDDLELTPDTQGPHWRDRQSRADNVVHLNPRRNPYILRLRENLGN
jgi:hypothetical protein